VRRNGWFRYCRSRWETDLTEQIALLEEKRPFVAEIIAGLNCLIATLGSAQ
jgi:hypothetical protein